MTGSVAPDLGGWLHTLNPVVLPVAGEIAIRWYGLAYIAGFVAGYFVIRAAVRRGMFPIEPARLFDVFLAMIVGLVVGGRLGYCLFYQPSLLWSFDSGFPWWGVLRLNEGGMASHGGMIGLILGVLWAKRGFKDDTGKRHPGPPALAVLDATVLGAPLGLAFGRVANFINGELLGAVVAQPGERAPWWAVRYPHELLSGFSDVVYSPQQSARLDALLAGFQSDPLEPQEDTADRVIGLIQRGDQELAMALEPLLSARHPSQLYQAFAEGIVVLACVVLVSLKPQRAGVLGAVFLVVYGVARIVTEWFRLPDAHLIDAGHAYVLGLSRGQMLSVLMIAAGIGLAVMSHVRRWPTWGGWLARRRATSSKE